jgi:hypothetical protein
MSALGQKQTCAPQNGMSALLPIATAKADSREKSCLLYPQERTCAAQTVMSALGQKRTFEFAPVETNVVKRMLPPSDTAKEDRAGH